MRDLGLRLASAGSLLLLPALALQGHRVRRTTPRLPGAAGPREGRVSGSGRPVHLLVLGESTAAGVGAADHAGALAGQAARALAGRSGREVRWRVLGRNGATAEVARRELLTPALDLRGDVAVIALGVNDTLRLRGPRRWGRDLAALVAAVRERCGPIPVVLAAVPPMGEFPALPQPLRGVLGLRSRLLDRAAVRLAHALPGVRHVPMPPTDSRAPGAFFCADGFHPSPGGYRVWGAVLGAAAAVALAETGGGDTGGDPPPEARHRG